MASDFVAPQMPENFANIALNAYAATAAIADRKAQLEGKLMEYKNQADAAELRSSQQAQNFTLRQQALQNTIEQQGNMYTLKVQALQNAEQATANKAELDHQKMTILQADQQLRSDQDYFKNQKILQDTHATSTGLYNKALGSYGIREEDVNADIWHDAPGNPNSVEGYVAARDAQGNKKLEYVDPKNPKKGTKEQLQRVQMPRSELEYFRKTGRDLRQFTPSPAAINPPTGPTPVDQQAKHVQDYNNARRFIQNFPDQAQAAKQKYQSMGYSAQELDSDTPPE